MLYVFLFSLESLFISSYSALIITCFGVTSFMPIVYLHIQVNIIFIKLDFFLTMIISAPQETPIIYKLGHMELVIARLSFFPLFFVYVYFVNYYYFVLRLTNTSHFSV